MPRLSALQWTAVAVFLFFYGFTVFAVTRDFYLRQLAQPSAAAAPSASHGVPSRSPGRAPAAGPPASVAETDPARLAREADALFVEGRYGDAIPLYRRLIELKPNDVAAHNDLGLALQYSGESEAALTLLRAGAAKDPTHQRIRLTLGFVSLQSGDLREARSALEQARDLGPDTEVGREASRLLDLVDDR